MERMSPLPIRYGVGLATSWLMSWLDSCSRIVFSACNNSGVMGFRVGTTPEPACSDAYLLSSIRMPGASAHAANKGINPTTPHLFRWVFEKKCMKSSNLIKQACQGFLLHKHYEY